MAQRSIDLVNESESMDKRITDIVKGSEWYKQESDMDIRSVDVSITQSDLDFIDDDSISDCYSNTSWISTTTDETDTDTEEEEHKPPVFETDVGPGIMGRYSRRAFHVMDDIKLKLNFDDVEEDIITDEQYESDICDAPVKANTSEPKPKERLNQIKRRLFDSDEPSREYKRIRPIEYSDEDF